MKKNEEKILTKQRFVTEDVGLDDGDSEVEQHLGIVCGVWIESDGDWLLLLRKRGDGIKSKILTRHIPVL